MATKTATVSFRVSPDIKELVTLAAQAERRNLSNLFEVMALEYCGKRGISVPPKKLAKGNAK